jgi:polar amino acid transport system substrate-binding protein
LFLPARRGASADQIVKRHFRIDRDEEVTMGGQHGRASSGREQGGTGGRSSAMKRMRLPVLATGILLALLPLQAPAQQGSGAPLVIGIEEEASTYGGILGRLIYAEISRRLGRPIEVRAFPLQRRSALSDEGAIDGETSRIHAYGAGHPNLVRVEEPVIDLNFALYTANSALSIQRLEDLGAGAWRGEYRRGVLFCERALKSVLPPDRVSDVAETVQGVKKLLAGRTDIYCELDFGIVTVLHDNSIKGVEGVRKLLDLGDIPTYPYLHKRHADLAPRMAAVIRKIKADGLIEAYRIQARRDMGWEH